MLDNINEILFTITVVLAVSAVALRGLLRVNRVEWIKRLTTWLLEYVDVGLSALVIALVIRSFVIEPFKIPSSSMEDTLLIGDHLFVNRFIYGLKIPYVESRPLALRQPRRGDIIVFVPPHQRDKDFIKRIVGVPGDTVEMRNQAIFVNGSRVTEPFVMHKDSGAHFIAPPARDNMRLVRVPPGKYFMMGDNRDRSEDSRYWGFAALADIKGKAMIIYFSADPNVPLYDLIHKIRWGRLLHLVK